MIPSVVFLLSAILVGSALDSVDPEDDLEENDESEFVTLSKNSPRTGFDATEMQAEYNITSIGKFLPRGRRTPPRAYDWRVDYHHKVVPPAEHQDSCYVCSVFSFVYMLECQYAIKTKRLVSLSKQQVVDCMKICHAPHNYLTVFDYVKKNGLQGTRTYGPYLSTENTCHFDRKKAILGVRGDIITFTGHDAIVKMLYHVGPIAAALITPPSYGGGIIRLKGEQCDLVNHSVGHAVLIVGYGVTPDGLKYWICKNTYGTDFGIQKGYFKVERGRNTLCLENLGILARVMV